MKFSQRLKLAKAVERRIRKFEKRVTWRAPRGHVLTICQLDAMGWLRDKSVPRAHRDEFRAMRSLLIRIHSARIAMSHQGVLDALDDVDKFFREPNTN
jgi:hypothetical protein